MADYRIRVFVDPSGAVAGSRTAEQAVRRIGQAADDVSNRSVDGLMDKLRGMGGVLKVSLIVAGAVAYGRMADEITAANSQLRLASRSQADLLRLQQSSYATAQRQGVSFGSIATLTAKSVKSARDMGYAWDAAAKLGEDAAAAVAAGIRVSGTSAQAAAAGVFQLSQALASGTLRGDELNSVMENIPGVADALAKALGVPVGQLRAMGKEGQLTSKMVIEGLQKARPELERLAALIPLTFSGAFQKVRNAAGQLFTGLDKEGLGIGGVVIAAMNGAAKAMEFLASKAEVLGNIITGVVIASLVKVALASRAAGMAALAQARDNAALAASELAVARAQQQRAIASLAVARSRGGALAGNAGAAAAQVAAASANVARLTQATNAANAAVAATTARAGLMGRAFVAAAGVARAALAMIGGPIGLAIAALVALIAWAGKAALGFKPIANEAGTVGDYIAVAFEDASSWAGQKLAEFSTWAKKKISDISGYVRPVAVYIVDAFLNAARGAAGAVSGIVAAWRAGIDNIKGLLDGLASDAKAAMSGNFTTAGIRGAWGRTTNIGAAFGQGFSQGYGSTFTGVSGESVVGAIEKLPGAIRDGISDFARRSGWRDRANRRAGDRERAANMGGDDGGQRTPFTADGKDGPTKKDRSKKEKDERTFQDILDDAREQAKLAAMTAQEREKEEAILAAQKELKRDLVQAEKDQLKEAITLKQTNEANQQLAQETLATYGQILENRVNAAAEEARKANNSALAIALEAELAVQKKLLEAKAAGVELDKQKLEAYRQAVVQAGIEGEAIKKQNEAKEALAQIAENARKSMQTAVSDAIYGALNGDIKGVKGLFKSFGQIIKRQLAEQITYGLFSKQGAQQNQVTRAAVDVARPAAQAVADAAMQIVTAMQQAASAISPSPGGQDPLAPLADGIAQAAQVWDEGAGKVGGGIDSVQGVLQQGAGGLGGVIGKVIGVLGQLLGFGGMGGAGQMGGGLGGILGGLTGPNGLLSGLGKLFGGGGAAGAAGGAGGMAGMMGSISSVAGPAMAAMAIADTLTSLLGGEKFAGGLFGVVGNLLFGKKKKTPSGSVEVTSAGVGKAKGTSSDMKQMANKMGEDMFSSLRDYARELLAPVGDFGSIRIGQHDGDYRVNIGSHPNMKAGNPGVYDFNDDYEAALEFAIKTAVERGALTGLSTAVTEAIKKGTATVDEAVRFEKLRRNINRRALAMVDPVRAAVEDVNDEFKVMLMDYKQFGEDTTNLEKVYLDARQKAIDEALKDQLGGIRNFLDELKGGATGGASLTERVNYQSAAFLAMENALAAGRTVDTEELERVGRALLDAQRELNGATPEFYATVDRVQVALEAAIRNATNQASTDPLPLLDFTPEAVSTPIVEGLDAVNDTLTDGFNGVIETLSGVWGSQLQRVVNERNAGSGFQTGGF